MFTGAVCNLSTGNFRVNDLKSHLSYADDTFLSLVIHYTDTALKIKYWGTCEEESISDNYCLMVEEVLHDIEDGTLVFLDMDN